MRTSLALALSLAASLILAAPGVAADRPPNVIFILADDKY